MISSGLSGKPTLCGLLALSAMEIVATQKSGLPLAKLQQPTRGWQTLMADSAAEIQPNAVRSRTPLVEAKPALTEAPGFAESSAIATTATTSDSFRDLQSHWSQPFVELLAARGIVRGYGDGTFQPDREIQAAHFGIMLHRAKLYRLKVLQRELGMVNHKAIAPAPAGLTVATATPATETEAAILLQTHNIRTRAQAAVFIYRNMQEQVVGQVPAVDAAGKPALPEPTSLVQTFKPDFAEPAENAAPSLSEGFQWPQSTLIAQG